MQFLSAEGITQSFGTRIVLDGVSVRIQPGDRIGLVGANGAGKSTLLRVLTGELTPEAGSVERASGTTIGYLPQDTTALADRTVDRLLDEAIGGLLSTERELRDLEEALTASFGDRLAIVLEQYADAMERLDQLGGYGALARVESLTHGLRVDELARERPLGELSGGEQTRVLLAGLLLRAPELLLLDEPTNNLDFGCSGWLEEFLATYPGSVFAASHDRAFLNRVATRIIEIDEHSHRHHEYVGNYDAYRQAQLRAREQQERAYETQQDEMQDLRHAIKVTARQVAHNRRPRDNDKMGYHGHGEFVQRAISTNVRAAETRLRRLESEALARPPRALRINPDLDPAEIRSDEVIRLEHVSAHRGDREVLSDVSFTLGSRSRVVVVGENGAGKTTLLDLIAGWHAPTHGSVVVAGTARLGYLDQQAGWLRGDRSMLEAYLDGRQGPREELINELFHFGFFRPEEVQTPVSALSVGQRRKLQLARLIGQKANVLLLDEPTNHLSLDLVEALEQALTEFRGAILAVSHDRWFIEQFDGEVWELKDGRLRVRS